MPTIQQSITINRTPEVIFKFFSNVENNTKWQSGLKSSKQISPGPAGVGTKLVDTRELLGQKIESEYEITAFEPNKKVTLTASGGPITYVGTFTFDAAGSGTKVSSSFDFQVGGALKMMEGSIVGQAQKQFESDFARLKELLEAM